MVWFIGIMLILFCLFFWALIFTIKFKQREENDPELMTKMEKWRKKWNPKIDFIENLSLWIFGLVVIYLIFLGGSQ